MNMKIKRTQLGPLVGILVRESPSSEPLMFLFEPHELVEEESDDSFVLYGLPAIFAILDNLFLCEETEKAVYNWRHTFTFHHQQSDTEIVTAIQRWEANKVVYLKFFGQEIYAEQTALAWEVFKKLNPTAEEVSETLN